MIDPEKIRLMTKLEIFKEKNNVLMREISHKYKTDYVSGKVLITIIKYSFLFLLGCLIYILTEMDKWIVSFNLAVIEGAIENVLKYYFFGALIAVIISLIYYNRRYQRIDFLRQQYCEGLEDLLVLTEEEKRGE